MSNSEPVVLGSGNFSTTYLKSEQGKDFVLKRIKPKHRDNPKVIRIFENEELFQFDREGLPKDVRYFEDYGEHFLVKPFVAGKSLEELRKELKGEQLKQIILELLELLIYLEENEITHCDIKPSNVLLGEDGKVHLLDFGLAQRLGDPKINYTLFSLGFAAPELILNRRMIVDTRSDIYSFGMLLYFMILGQLPYADDNPSHFTQLQITYPIPSSKKVDKNLMQLILKCCHKYQFELPPNRYQDLDLDKRLWAGMKERYQSFSDVKSEIESFPASAFQKKRSIF
ncbi:MAG: protein kinase [Crocinitomicaceae bacterium]